MIREKIISTSGLMTRCEEILEEIHRDGVVYIIKTDHRDTVLVPSGLVDDSGEIAFVLGPEQITGRVIGLMDEEYGWPELVDVQNIKTVRDLSPARRRHPFVYRGSVCLAVSIMIREYEQIKQAIVK